MIGAQERTRTASNENDGNEGFSDYSDFDFVAPFCSVLKTPVLLPVTAVAPSFRQTQLGLVSQERLADRILFL